MRGLCGVMGSKWSRCGFGLGSSSLRVWSGGLGSCWCDAFKICEEPLCGPGLRWLCCCGLGRHQPESLILAQNERWRQA